MWTSTQTPASDSATSGSRESTTLSTQAWGLNWRTNGTGCE